MLGFGTSVLAWRWLLPAVPFVAIAARLARGVWVLRAFEQQRRASHRRRRARHGSPECLCVADALHKPLAALSTAAIVLRLAFFSLAVGAGDGGSGHVSTSAAYYWLAQAPSVVYAALSAYLALLMLVIVHTRRWPGSGDSRGGAKRRTAVVAATAGCLVFCALLLAAVTLLAVTRNISLSTEKHVAPPQLRGLARAALLYLAFVWSVLGLLLLRSQANAARVLLGYDPYDTIDTLPYYRSPDPEKTIPPMFVMKLSRGAVLLALLLLLRGVYSLAAALLFDSQQLTRWFLLAHGGRWSEFWAMIVLDLCWELLALLAIVSLLKTMPLAVYSWPSPGRRARTATTESTAETDATDESDETDEVDEAEQLLPARPPPSPSSSAPVIGFRFQLPTLHELVQDYVVVTRQSLTRRLAGADDVIYTYAHGEPERCVHQEPSAPSPRASAAPEETHEPAGSEFMECQCPRRRHPESATLLPEAQVPLLSDDDGRDLADESFEVIDALSDTHSDNSQVLSGSS
jgi:hypothetical protein